MTDYPNLPVIDNTPHSPDMLKVDEIPYEYVVFKKDVKKAHFVHEKNLERGVISEGTAVCGTDCARIETDSNIPIGNCCRDCLSWMDQFMEGYLFDEYNQEYYDPIKER